MNDEVATPMPEAGSDGSHAEGQAPEDTPDRDGVMTARIRATAQRVQRTRTNPPAVKGPITRPGGGIGSWAYMSPEQWSNAHAVGPATDIYSLGVVAYQALAGRAPFTGNNANDYYWCHLEAEVPPLGCDFSLDLDRAVQRALAKSPDARHGNVLELASELRAALRASEREQLRVSAQQWADRAQAPGLLWGHDVLAEFERWTRRAPSGALSELECSFVAASQRRARRARWVRRALVVLAGVIALAVVWYRAALMSQTAEQLVTQAEGEQGRSALLHDESSEAQLHLAAAYQRGDHSRSTMFMLARALQPRLAEQLRFASTSGRMWSAVFSPDGKQIVITDDRSAQVRDAQTGRLLFTLPHGDAVYHAVYSADGRVLVTASGDGTVRIWDATDGALMRTLRRDGNQLRYFAVAMSPDGAFVAAIDTTGAVAHVWDAATGDLLAEVRNVAAVFPSIAFSADGRWLATSGGDDVRVFDARTWTQAVTLAGPGIHSLSFDPTGTRLLTGSTVGDASIWAIPSGDRIRHLREVGEPIDSVAFSPNGQLVVTASRDGAEQVWNAGSGALQSQGNYLRGKIQSIEFDRASVHVLATGAAGMVVVADATLGAAAAVLEGPRSLKVAHFDPSSRRAVGASWDGTAWVWDTTSPYRRWSSPQISDDCGIATSLEPDRRFVAVGCIDHSTRVWDTSHDQMLAELPGVTQVDGDFSSAFPAVSAAGDRAAIARGNTVQVYGLPGGRLLRTIAHVAPVTAVSFAPTGHDLVSGATDGSLLVTRDGRDPVALPTFAGGIDAAGFLADGRVVAADTRQRLRVYDQDRHAVIAELAVPSRVGLLRMSLDGLRLITIPTYTGKAPTLWNLEHYRPIAQLEGHLGRVFSARFVAGGEILTTGGDGTVRLWDGATGQLRRTYRGSSLFLADATVTPDGAMVVAGGGDGLLRFWDAASERLLWKLAAHKSSVVGIRVECDDIVTRGLSGEVSRWTLPKPRDVVMACYGREACDIVPR